MLLGNVANNAIFFGEYVLVAAGIDATSKEHSSIYNPSARGIALAATTVACLIHGSWRQGGVWLNNLFAVVKVLMLLLIIIVGILAGAGVWHTNHASENMALDNSFDNVTNDTYGYSEAFLGVIFAYSGFNQANYVCCSDFPYINSTNDPRCWEKSGILDASSSAARSALWLL